MSDFDNKLPVRVPKMSPVMQSEFKRRGFTGLYIAGPDRVVPRYLGDNRGSRPIRFGITGNWEDTVTNTLDTGQWSCWAGVLFRVWCADRDAALRLEGAIEMYVADRYDAEPMRKKWLDLGPDLDLNMFALDIRSVGERIAGRAWSDADLYHALMCAERERNARDLKHVTDILERRRRA